MPVNLKHLIKECVLEVLKENLQEGFDPTSMGPRPEATEMTQYNPYPAFNAEMQKLEEEGQELELVPTGQSDDWSRPIYRDQSGRIYVDINLGKGTPSIHTVSDEGEPEVPVKNFKIVGASPQAKHANALCPRCKNSKPELMKKTPDGKMSCTYCHWVDNPHEPYNPPHNLK